MFRQYHTTFVDSARDWTVCCLSNGRCLLFCSQLWKAQHNHSLEPSREHFNSELFSMNNIFLIYGGDTQEITITGLSLALGRHTPSLLVPTWSNGAKRPSQFTIPSASILARLQVHSNAFYWISHASLHSLRNIHQAGYTNAPTGAENHRPSSMPFSYFSQFTLSLRL